MSTELSPPITAAPVTTHVVRDDVSRYYDRFVSRVLADYANGNRRIEAAIAHALRWIPAGAGRILDVGCGIGWSTREFAKQRPSATVLGVDLSERMIDAARALADCERVWFEAQDLCEWQLPTDERFDAIVLLDVYEHIVAGARAKVHTLFDEWLSPGGVLILTCPTKSHQDHLRRNDPEGLQPIDEDITAVEIAQLAEDLNADIVHAEVVSIWRPGDYQHVALRRRGAAASPENPVEANAALAALETVTQRRERILARLGMRVTPQGLMLRDAVGPTLCIATRTLGKYSETFIRDHLVRLPFAMRVLSARPNRTEPELDEFGRSLHPAGRKGRLLERVRSTVTMTPRAELRERRLAEHLVKQQVSVVLAEYGPTGVLVESACRRAGVPLIVHFHGFDAYESTTLVKRKAQYARLFESASACVAVSRDMREQLVRLGAPAEKVEYIPYFVDPREFALAAPETAEPRIVSVGRFVEKKAPHLSLLAFADVVRAVPEARLTMIGNGPLEGVCRSLARAAGIEHAVTFAGARSHDFVRAQMQSARAFVQHSVVAHSGDAEGTPVAVLEAQASGLPVVATRHMGIKDVVVDTETGFLVDEGDVASMSAQMIRLAREGELAAELGQAGRARIATEFSYDRTLGKLVRLIERVSNGALHALPASGLGGN